MPLLTRVLRGQFSTSLDIINDAVEDALLEYLRKPEGYDPSRGIPLPQYLGLAARRNVLNAIASEARRRAREDRWARLCAPVAATAAADESESARLRQVRETACQHVETLEERRALLAWLAGERRTGVLARCLGLEARTQGDQRACVRRFKDRVLKRLFRSQRHDRVDA